MKLLVIVRDQDKKIVNIGVSEDGESYEMVEKICNQLKEENPTHNYEIIHSNLLLDVINYYSSNIKKTSIEIIDKEKIDAN